MQSGKVIQQILKEFRNAGIYGYEVDYSILKASDYGVPQSRERVIIMGIRKDLDVKPEFPKKCMISDITVDQAISDLPQIEAVEGLEKMTYASTPQKAYQKRMRKDSKVVYNHIAMKHTKRLIESFEVIKPGKNLVDVWDTHGAVKRGNPKEKSTIKFSPNNLRLIADKPEPNIAASFQSNFIHSYLNRNFPTREGQGCNHFLKISFLKACEPK